jgi:hypothetical protein
VCLSTLAGLQSRSLNNDHLHGVDSWVPDPDSLSGDALLRAILRSLSRLESHFVAKPVGVAKKGIQGSIQRGWRQTKDMIERNRLDDDTRNEVLTILERLTVSTCKSSSYSNCLPKHEVCHVVKVMRALLCRQSRHHRSHS